MKQHPKYPNIKYYDFPRFKKPTRKQAELFFQHSYAQQRSKWNPEYTSYVIRRGDNWEEPCDVYLYETSIKGIRKFGIASDHVLRASGSGKPNRYREPLAVYTLPERRDALLIESYLKEKLKRPKITPEIIDELDNSTELTTSSEKEFHKVIKSGLEILSKDGAEKLIQEMDPYKERVIQDNKFSIDSLEDGESVLFWSSMAHKRRGKIAFGEFFDRNINPWKIEDLTWFNSDLEGEAIRIKENLNASIKLIADNWKEYEKQIIYEISSNQFIDYLNEDKNEL